MNTRRPLRILMLVLNQVGKGAYWRALQPAERLAQRGHHVTLMAMSNGRWQRQTTTHNNVQIIATPDLLWGKLRSGWDLWQSLNRILWLRHHSFDIVHFFESRPTTLIPTLYMKHWRGTAVINDWSDWFGRGGSVEERPNKLLKTILRPVETFFEQCYRPYVDGMTVVCTTLQNKAIGLGLPPDKILFWRDGADTDGITPLDKQSCRQKLGLPQDKTIIGYIGAIFYNDAQLMAQAFDHLQQQHPETCLLLAGYMNMPIEEMVADKTAVHRTDYIPYHQISAYLSACDICWLPFCNSLANQGRYPTKLNDYMAAGRPTIATAVGDVANIVAHHQIGRLAQPTPHDIATQTANLINQPQEQIRLGQNARHLAENEFNWEHRTTDLETFYYQTLAQDL